jgi:hypothetical protein
LKKYIKFRKLGSDNSGSIDPVIIFFLCIGIASIMILIFGEVLTPFFQLGSSVDDDINPSISAPRGYFMAFLGILWPKGLLLVILFSLIFCLLMTYQKNRYKEMV